MTECQATGEEATAHLNSECLGHSAQESHGREGEGKGERGRKFTAIKCPVISNKIFLIHVIARQFCSVACVLIMLINYTQVVIKHLHHNHTQLEHDILIHTNTQAHVCVTDGLYARVCVCVSLSMCLCVCVSGPTDLRDNDSPQTQTHTMSLIWDPVSCRGRLETESSTASQSRAQSPQSVAPSYSSLVGIQAQPLSTGNVLV